MYKFIDSSPLLPVTFPSRLVRIPLHRHIEIGPEVLFHDPQGADPDYNINPNYIFQVDVIRYPFNMFIFIWCALDNLTINNVPIDGVLCWPDRIHTYV